MSKTKSTMKPIALAIGTTLAGLSAVNAAPAANPFAMTDLSSGYQVASMADGKCGAGKCGGDMKKKDAMADGKCGAGKCGGDMKKKDSMADGKCGAGKCGGDMKKKDAKVDGKCGSGKCGGSN